MAPAYQQRPQAPPPTPHFQRGSPALPPPPVQVPAAVPPHIGHTAPHMYPHGPPAPPPPIQPGPAIQFPPFFMQNTGQSYAIPPPLVHGSSLLPHAFSNTPQNLQHPLQLGVRNHHIPPPGPPPPEMSLSAVQPPRVLPPPPASEGQTFHRTPLHQPPPHSGDRQSLQHILPPPPTAATYVQSTLGDSHIPSIAPPPLPSSPPPIPPCPPPANFDLTSASPITSVTEMRDLDSFDEVIAPHQLGCGAHALDANSNQYRGSNREVTSLARDALSSTKSAILDLHPPPSKPTEDKIVKNIDVLCQLIAENGPVIEDKTIQDESTNPEFEFLFGGDPGTEADIAHHYFQWMKAKCILEYRLREGRHESQSRPLDVESSGQPDHLKVATVCNSTADSDMEMEDDITLFDKDQELDHSTEGINQEHDLFHKELNRNERSPGLHNSAENNAIDTLSDSGHVKSPRLAVNGHIPVTSSAETAECQLGIYIAKSVGPRVDDFGQSGASSTDIKTNTHSGQLIRTGTPIRLLQDYTSSDDISDNEDEPCGDVSVSTVSPIPETGAMDVHKYSGNYLEMDMKAKSPSRTEEVFGLLFEKSQNALELSPDAVRDVPKTLTTSVSSGPLDESFDHSLKNQVPRNCSASNEAIQEKDGLNSVGVDVSGNIDGAEEENEEKTTESKSTPLKVDEFGRLIREGPIDSDSDDSRNPRTKRHNKRDRSWSRSRSPLGRRRRRRSPRKRKERRSRSRSWSPRNRRSRSRSPLVRRSGQHSGDYMRREKDQACFDFLRGRCRYGASCRYVHHESEKTAGSSRQRNKHDTEVRPSSKYYRVHEETRNNSNKLSGHDHDGVTNQEMKLCQNVTGIINGQEIDWRREDSVRSDMQSTSLDHDGQSVHVDKSKSESSREVSARLPETLIVGEKPEVPTTHIHDDENFQKAMESHQSLLVDRLPSKPISDARTLKSQGDTSSDLNPSLNSSLVRQSQLNLSVGELESSDHPFQVIDDSIKSYSSPGKRSVTSGSNISAAEPLPYMLPSPQPHPITGSFSQGISPEQSRLQFLVSEESPLHGTSTVDLSCHPHQLPPPPAFPLSQDGNAAPLPQMSRDYSLIPLTTFPYQSASRESFQPYQATFPFQHSHFSVPPNSSWTSLLPPPPPPRPHLSVGPATPHVSSQFYPSQLRSGNDFVSQTSVRPNSTDLPSHSQVSEFHSQTYHSMQEPPRSQSVIDSFTSKSLPVGNPACQPFAGPSLGNSSFTSSGNMHPHPKDFSWEGAANKFQPSSEHILPPGELLKSSSELHPFTQRQQPLHSLHYSAADGASDLPGENVSVSRYAPDGVDRNQSARVTDFGGSRIPVHYNPYASTFEQPLSSRFNSSLFRQDKDTHYGNKYDTSSNLIHNPVDVEGVYHVGSRQRASSPNIVSVRQILPRSGGDQYNPLEPSSNSLKKSDHDQKQEITGESDIILRPGGSYKLLDVEENNKNKDVADGASTSSFNNEYGETADAEVGVVENESPSDPVDASMPTGDIEIDQIKSPGKRKKNKDSRSMKLFKVSIANFVKEVLKPSWRQGNMSKVAFKTIVKKTVDKVSGAMKGHQVPKSQAKINQYIDSSQRKLTKLVMGYVDKYVKV
ncbi:Zinc finger CCCH domain-containing protein 55 [Quillaja saponaria]|uniref:Zinc finger CCCH domain-containing protein 55 n=1 Tax=Quillaja saponaria TaxID=32244 RepID=A0AAD7PI49_QUISA|nr:Zinc finger CCCH domain-containing protein 55 [Quillaja saponaria]KAJ7956487.1 Zinc finger CCCH domain-containing protein 55 [Quillaja saponaria]